MRRLILILLLAPSYLLGSGFLGKSNNIVFYADELVTHRNYSFEYQRIFTRHFSLLGNMSYLNNSFKVDDKFKFIAEKGDVHVRGLEYHIGMLIGNFTANNVLPLGMSNGFRVGGGRYSSGNGIVDNKYSIFCFEYLTRANFNLYRNLNAFVGINIGVYNAFGGDLITEDPNDVNNYKIPFFLVQRGINKNYSLSKEPAAFLFRFNYGISYVFGK